MLEGVLELLGIGLTSVQGLRAAQADATTGGQPGCSVGAGGHEGRLHDNGCVAALLLGNGVVGDDAQVRAVVDDVVHLPAQGVAIPVHALGTGGAFDEAILAPDGDRASESKPVGDGGQAAACLHVVAAEVARPRIDPEFGFLQVRLLGPDLQGAGAGVAPEQGALGSAQDLDHFHVHQVAKGDPGAA